MPTRGLYPDPRVDEGIYPYQPFPKIDYHLTIELKVKFEPQSDGSYPDLLSQGQPTTYRNQDYQNKNEGPI